MFCTQCRYIPRTAIFVYWVDELIENCIFDPDEDYHYIFAKQEESNNQFLLFGDKPNAFDKYLLRIKCIEINPKLLPFVLDYIFQSPEYFEEFSEDILDYILDHFKPFKVIYKRIPKKDVIIDDE